MHIFTCTARIYKYCWSLMWVNFRHLHNTFRCPFMTCNRGWEHLLCTCTIARTPAWLCSISNSSPSNTRRIMKYVKHALLYCVIYISIDVIDGPNFRWPVKTCLWGNPTVVHLVTRTAFNWRLVQRIRYCRWTLNCQLIFSRLAWPPLLKLLLNGLSCRITQLKLHRLG